jgi:hypothetical protein
MSYGLLFSSRQQSLCVAAPAAAGAANGHAKAAIAPDAACRVVMHTCC